MNGLRIFPDDYYTITTWNQRNKKTSNWFCNRPLTPTPVLNEGKIENTSECSSLHNESDKSCETVNLDKDPDFNPHGEEDANTSESSSPPEFSPGSLFSSKDSEDGIDVLRNKSPIPNNSKTIKNTILNQNNNNDCSIAHNNADTSFKSRNIVENFRNKNKKEVMCYFCETLVTNFPRHLFRNHSGEIEVQKISSLPPLDSRRKTLLASLRKQGSYLMSNEVVRPVRKGNENSNYLPCKDCLGFYSTKNLWRHRKICKLRTSTSLEKNVRGEAQNFLLRRLEVHPLLKKDIFPRMRCDKISLEAKRDPLICEFALRYLRIHREKHYISVASRKMRELGRLLLELKQIEPTVGCLFEALKPKYYDILVSATKAAAKYDIKNQTYTSPTYALQMGTTLKQLCDIALVHTYKKSNIISVQSGDVEAELKTLVQIITGNWRFDVSSEAASDLNLQKWNKVNLVPLASDLKLLKDYLIAQANASLLKLQKDVNNLKAYMTLLETIYCRLILLNRRRPGELQRLLMKTYLTALDQKTSQNYEEFSEAISDVERFLMARFKRIVIRGKRGRGVPVLISQDVQDHIAILLKCRENFSKKHNLYVFGNPKSDEPIIGYKVFKKYATQCGSKNPQALSCTKLRKHLATLTQLFNMNENDMEQLASFMGHTLGIHRSAYRLPDDVYQTARISKLLLLMERGEAGQFKGKSLDEINLNLEENLTGNTEENLTRNAEETDSIVITDEGANIPTQELKNNTEIRGKRKKRVLVPWTEEQKRIVRNFFNRHLREKRSPKQKECDELRAMYPEIFKNKTWLKIKVFIQNEYRKT